VLTQRKRHAAQQRILSDYSFDVRGFITRFLHWEPWQGTDEMPGQVEIIHAYTRIIKTQIEKQDLEIGSITLADCEFYQPGQIIQKAIHIQKGHNTGGTKLAAALVNHFLHSFSPSIVYTYAPNWKQIKNLLWKEILSDRVGSGLPGKTLDGALRIDLAPGHFATGVATKNLSKEDVQGQHQQFLMFVMDEAEGMPDFLFEAIDTMASGGIVIILYLANPRTRTSRFHRIRSSPEVAPFRISCINFPNVREDRDLIPGAVTRAHVCNMVRDQCVIPNGVQEKHSEDDFTFTLSFEVKYHMPDGYPVSHEIGTIFKPTGDFLYQILGIPPVTGAGDVLINVGRFEAALRREADELPVVDLEWAQIGCDVARFGFDRGSFFSKYAGQAKRFAMVDDAVTQRYVELITDEAELLRRADAKRLTIRVDGTGGFGAGVIDLLRADPHLFPGRGEVGWFEEVRVHEVHFGANAYTPRGRTPKYKDIITQCYAETNESLMGTCLIQVPPELELDLCDRKYRWYNYLGVQVKLLEEKEKFRTRHGRSPDDGDACVLCLAPEFLFVGKRRRKAKGIAGARR